MRDEDRKLVQIALCALFIVALTLAVGQALAETYTVGGVVLTDAELEAYQSTIVTEANRMRQFKARAEDALKFFDALDPSLFTEPEKAKIQQAKVVVRLAAKRQLEQMGAAPSTPRDVKLRLLQRAVADAEDGSQAKTDAQAALDAWLAANPE